MVGSQDADLSEEGLAQARAAVDALAGRDVTEIITSPLARALQTANLLAQARGIDTTRDPRLAAVDLGTWEGRPVAELEASPAYRAFIEGGEGSQDFFAEPLDQVDQRVRASVQQALVDNPGDGNIVVITHRIPIGLLIAEYMKVPVASYHRIGIDPGSISVVRFDDYPRNTSVIATNWRGSDLAAALG